MFYLLTTRLDLPLISVTYDQVRNLDDLILSHDVQIRDLDDLREFLVFPAAECAADSAAVLLVHAVGNDIVGHVRHAVALP